MSIPAGATGIGSMPGTSVVEAVAIVAGELPDLPHLVELPARGPGADLVGRTGVLLSRVAVDFALETVPTGWRRLGQVTRELRRAGNWLGEDLDRAQEVFGDSDGAFKVQLCGPWTWAAMVETGAGQPVLRDDGFRADLAEAWREAAAAHLADVARRLPLRSLVLQVDEPSLPAVLGGQIGTASGFSRVPAVGNPEAAALLRRAVADLPAPAVLHCCDQFPFDVAALAGFAGLSWDCSPKPGGPDSADAQPAPEIVDAVAAAAESGVQLVLGVVPSSGPVRVDESWRRIEELWRRTGLPDRTRAQLAVSPACGLSGGSLASARAALAAAAELARRCAG